MKILIVRLTSMGDLIHALPALTDAAKADPNLQIDWVADEVFASIPTLHPRVDQVITTATRRWKKNIIEALISGEVIRSIRTLRAKKYDLIIDAQGNMKSAILTALARGVRCGPDKNSVREKFAHWAYNKTFSVPQDQHAIARTRQLFAQALNYPLPKTEPDYGIDLKALPALPIELPKPYLVFIHATTWDTKHWPENHWAELITMATQAGYTIALPWGSEKERERAERLEKVSEKAIVLPRLSIPQQATMIAGSAGAVCVDTGLGHLTAALNIPALHLYGPTNPALIGATGKNQTHLVAGAQCAPCYLQSCKWSKEPACLLTELTPTIVWNHFLQRVQP